MALSNWDTLAVNEKGEPTNGTFESPLGVGVEFYKNWLYVRDPKAWQEGGSFVEPTVMEVQSGNFRYKDIQIIARRGPQNGVYAVIQSTTYPPKLEFPCEKCKAKKDSYFHEVGCPDHIAIKHEIMLGCGVYGFNDSEWVGVEQYSKDFLHCWIQGYEKEEMEMPGALFRPGVTAEEVVAQIKAEGRIRDEVFAKDGKVFMGYHHYEFDEHIRKIDLSKALRFNQGDAYFAGKTGTEIPATEPGGAEKPFLIQALQKEE